MTRQTGAAAHGRAVVIGGSMVGLAVARALSEQFREVVVLERDQFPKGAPDHRRGVPQSWHIHNLTLRGQRELDELFPGFVDEARKLGAMEIDHALDVARYTELGWGQQFESGFIALSATRILLEHAERERFFALVKNAVVLEGTRVEDLITAPRHDGLAVTGVVTSDPNHREIHADLVVDCAGRSARWKEWLTARGAPLPEETVVDSRCGYSSRFYRPRNPGQFPWKAMIVDSLYPNAPHWGVIVPLEHNDWVVTLGGYNGDYPPSDEEGYLRFAKNIITPRYYEALEQADPLTPVRTFRKLEMRWNHFERYRYPLTGFLAIGDSAWAYNPLYGQGMSIGVTCARILRDLLRKDPDLTTLARRYYPPAKRFASPPWEATAALDMLWPGTIGKRPWHLKLSLPLGGLLLGAGNYDPTVSLALLDGIHLLKQPHEMLTPAVLKGLGKYVYRKLTNTLPPGQHDRPFGGVAQGTAPKSRKLEVVSQSPNS